MSDNVTLPIQRLRVGKRVGKLSEDKDYGQELIESNWGWRSCALRWRFLSQSAEDYVYWVSGRAARRKIWFNAAPVDVAKYLRQRLFGADTSVIMTRATLAVRRNSPESKF